jgi:hypothetical protein
MILEIFNRLVHLPNKIFSPIKIKNFELRERFEKDGFIHYGNNPSYEKLIKKINIEVEKIDLDKIAKNAIEKNSKSYSIDIISYLNDNTKKDIDDYFSNYELEKAETLLGYKLVMRRMILLYNFFNPNSFQDEGPKMYHRDSDTLQNQLKIFVLLNDIDDENGMFYFVSKQNIKPNLSITPSYHREKMDVNNKWRIDDKFIKIVSNNNINHLNGKSGEVLYIDTGNCYHKGGFIKQKNKFRLMLISNYTPKFSLSNWNEHKSKILLFFQRKLTALKYKLTKKINLN